jgi:hypothetical protein
MALLVLVMTNFNRKSRIDRHACRRERFRLGDMVSTGNPPYMSVISVYPLLEAPFEAAPKCRLPTPLLPFAEAINLR